MTTSQIVLTCRDTCMGRIAALFDGRKCRPLVSTPSRQVDVSAAALRSRLSDYRCDLTGQPITGVLSNHELGPLSRHAF